VLVVGSTMTDTIAYSGVGPEAGARASVDARGTQTSFPGEAAGGDEAGAGFPVGPK